MSNNSQDQGKQANQSQNQPQKDPSSSQGAPRKEDPSASKVGNNTQKDEPLSQGNQKKENSNKDSNSSATGSKPAQDNRPQDPRKAV